MSPIETAEVNVERLVKALGFDPVKQNPTSSALAEALEEISLERTKELKEKAKKLLVEAIELRRAQAKVEAQFKESVNKFNKTMGKLMGQIEAISSGRPEPVQVDTTESND